MSSARSDRSIFFHQSEGSEGLSPFIDGEKRAGGHDDFGREDMEDIKTLWRIPTTCESFASRLIFSTSAFCPIRRTLPKVACEGDDFRFGAY
jgi:hypothetical protein